MNLFEKIFNYQILSRLEESGTLTITSQERAWLKTMLDQPAAKEAFSEETLEKLQRILQDASSLDTHEYVMERAKSREKQVFHPLLRPLHRCIIEEKGILLSYSTRNRRVNEEHEGFPYKLEYSMVKREWYLLWFHVKRRCKMSTKLSSITAVSALPLPIKELERIRHSLAALQASRKTTVQIKVVRQYNRELSRILYAFSCFEKEVSYDEEQGSYEVSIHVPRDEVEYLLSKIRFLGKRVQITNGPYLKKRMLETSKKALERYAEELENE